MKEKNIFKFIIPSMIASLFLGVYVLIDGAFIGIKMGDVGLSAINLAWPITAFIQAVGLAIGISGGIKISIACGKNNLEEERNIYNSTLWLLLIVSILFTIIFLIIGGPLLKISGATDNLYDYGYRYLKIMIFGSIFQVFSGGLVPLLKNKHKIKTAMLISMSGTLVNLTFDYLLIFVFEYDLVGAAIASIMSQAVISILAFIALKVKFEFKRIHIVPILIGMIAPFILNYSYAVITILNNTLCIKYGGASMVAAYTIFSYLLYIVSSSASGSGDGMQPLISFYYGKADTKNMQKTYYSTLIIGFLFSGLIIFSIFLLKDFIPQFYNLSETALSYYELGFNYYFYAFFLLVISRINGCFLYSSENIVLSNILILLEPLILTPIILISFALLFGNVGIFSSFLVIQVLLLIISIIFIYVGGKNTYEKLSRSCSISY